jgi:hypothetical protein
MTCSATLGICHVLLVLLIYICLLGQGLCCTCLKIHAATCLALVHNVMYKTKAMHMRRNAYRCMSVSLNDQSSCEHNSDMLMILINTPG